MMSNIISPFTNLKIIWIINIHLFKILNYLSISAGLSLIDINHNISEKNIYKQTDDALYHAKKTGRNKISLAKYNNENGFYEI